jgi:hypothetical protein
MRDPMPSEPVAVAAQDHSVKKTDNTHFVAAPSGAALFLTHAGRLARISHSRRSAVKGRRDMRAIVVQELVRNRGESRLARCGRRSADAVAGLWLA